MFLFQNCCNLMIMFTAFCLDYIYGGALMIAVMSCVRDFFIFTLFFFPASSEENKGFLSRNKRVVPLTAIHPAREKLLKEALSWMTFRRNGELTPDSEVESLFLEPLKEVYRTSKVYRSFVIAFKEVILPKLTLNENFPCDLDFHSKWKDPWNSSVTWHYQKNFTFELFEKRKQSTPAFCDYRQGLICNEVYKTCQCPQGSSMQEIVPKSPIKRCMLAENEICAIIDLDHGSGPRHTLLSKNLPYMIFNFEKPQSCMDGTQCRFKASNTKTPLCYWNNTGSTRPSWYPSSTTTSPHWKLPLGSECAIGLYADAGTCQVNTGLYGRLPGLVCYNFGPPHYNKYVGLPNRTGFCAHEYGSFGLAREATFVNDQLNFDPFINSFVHPRTVGLRDNDLLNYYMHLLNTIFPTFITNGLQVGASNEPCNVKKTNDMKRLWDLYKELTNINPQYEFSYAARPKTLKNSLAKLLQMATNVSVNVCRVYRTYSRSHSSAPLVTWPALECVPSNVTGNAGGNNGICQVSQQYDTDSLTFADALQKFLDNTSAIRLELKEEEYNFKGEILRAYPETECTPGLELTARSLKLYYFNEAPLEGGYCPLDYVCFEDYHDDKSLYKSNCDYLSGVQPKLEYACHDVVSNDMEYGKCEAVKLDERISQEAEIMVESSSSLGIGESCRHVVEWEIRNWYRLGRDSLNKYRLLVLLGKEMDNATVAGGGGPFCDSKRLLECKMNNTCDCVEGTEARRVEVEGIEYISEYCYINSGLCNGKDVSELAATTTKERDKIWSHYGDPLDAMCEDGNVCAYINPDPGNSQECGSLSNYLVTGEHDEKGSFVKEAGGIVRVSKAFFLGWILTFNLFISIPDLY